MIKPYYLDHQGRFVIEDYQHVRTFADFLPGVAGLYGIPMWAFFVNRGQAMSSFGIESKDRAILEFQPANKAYRLTSTQGFRTFLKIQDGKKQIFYEPFSNHCANTIKTRQRMIITSHDLTIEEVNTSLGLKFSVNYFTIPQEPFAAMVRQVTIENIGKKVLKIECIDGLPVINPYGLKDWLGKHMSRTVEAWVTVKNIKEKAPFYQFKVEVNDIPQVIPIKEGNFYFAFRKDSKVLLDMIVEASCVFGQATDFLFPEKFMAQKNFSRAPHQETANRSPCAMALSRFTLSKAKVYSFVAMAGFARDLAQLKSIVKKSCTLNYIDKSHQQNRLLIESIKDYCCTHSESSSFSQYSGQNFLDNILRGGLPVSLQTAEGPVSFNVYSRKHGDLERDYNFFTLAPTFYSQGNGNYRDVNQNRRNDVWFNRDVKDSALINFLNLIQADGYNPLIVKGTMFAIKDPKAVDEILKEFGIVQGADFIKESLNKGFMPGDLLQLIERQVPIKAQADEFLTKVLGLCAKQESAEPGEGFWSDHWTYNLDLIESYLNLYPEKLKSLVLQRRVFHFYLNSFYVAPRSERLVLTDAGARQYHSLVEKDQHVAAKAKDYKLRVNKGEGEPYTTTLLVKLICLLANKVATLDPSGIGIEMEANKPNWYDALNGLPGLIGSSISETFEVRRLADFVLEKIEKLNLSSHDTVMMFEELADFVQGLTDVLSDEPDPFQYWKKSNDLKEHYRHQVRYGIKGEEKALTVAGIKKFLAQTIERCHRGILKARYEDGLFATYFYHEVTEYDLLHQSHHGQHYVSPRAFKRHDLPLFLEGFVHALRVQKDIHQARSLYQAVKVSPLYDRQLRMYKVNASLSKESDEIGRTRIFPPGWLENESIWLHMEYKYLLELLRCGLHKEFFQELKSCLIPFVDPQQYARSILQNSSFIVSSAHEDKNLHGQGFVARLSGSTAEFLHMWLLMNMGLAPFGLDAKGSLTLTFKPLLPSWLFTRKAQEAFPAHTYAFKLFAKILVVYHNPQMKDTFGLDGARARKIILSYPTGKSIEISGDVLGESEALDVREGRLDRIEVYLD